MFSAGMQSTIDRLSGMATIDRLSRSLLPSMDQHQGNYHQQCNLLIFGRIRE
ncbi:hypothetical protein OROGR_009627 [Orobanche gracilis]